MNNNESCRVDDIVQQDKREELLTNDEIIRYIRRTSVVLTEKDFYPPPDKRYLQSGVNDATGGETFADYTKDFFNRYYDDMYDSIF